MKDERRFGVLLSVSFLICLLAIAYNVAGLDLAGEAKGYVKRRLYYESVISKKGLSLHRGQYWRKEGEMPSEED